jgi:spore coat polysaccharide biosynthesis protein SpsF (cytidylyltransferase family)
VKTVCIVQARTTSERFPIKIFAALHGKPMLAHVLERVAAIQGVDQVVLAVPGNDVRLVAHLWPHVFGGSEKDVLKRYAQAAEQYEANVIVRITGDCPLLAPNLAAQALRFFKLSSNINAVYLPYCQPYFLVADGWDVEIFQRRALVNADRYAAKDQREHVTTWMRAAWPRNDYEGLAPMTDWTALNCSVNTRDDLKRVELIMNHLEDKTDFSHAATWQAWEKAGRP